MSQTPLITLEGEIFLEDLPSAVLTPASLGPTLAKINRYAGRTKEPWSVAAHSVLVSRLCKDPEAQIWALLHDAHEAFIGDIISPAVAFIANQSQPIAGIFVENCVSAAKANLDGQVQRAWGIAPDATTRKVVDYCDRVALAAETFIFFGGNIDGVDEEELDVAIGFLRDLPNYRDWTAAAALWMTEVESLASRGLCKIPMGDPL